MNQFMWNKEHINTRTAVLSVFECLVVLSIDSDPNLDIFSAIMNLSSTYCVINIQ